MVRLFYKLKRWFHNQMIESEKADLLMTYSRMYDMVPRKDRDELNKVLDKELKKLDEKKMK